MIENEIIQSGPLRPEVDWSNVNVNPRTGLASDYINHYTDLSMLLEMLSFMPDCLDGVTAWKPIDYAVHFQRSGLKYSPQILLAYEDANHLDKQALDQVRKHYDPLILRAISAIENAAANDKADDLQRTTHDALQITIEAISELNRVINKVPQSL